jgi:hypothetical protein
VLFYGLIVAGATYLVHSRQCGETQLNKTLTINEIISAGDLLRPDQLALINKYARHEIKKGLVLTLDDVSPEKVPVSKTEPRLTAEISMPRPSTGEGVSAGDKVRLCVGSDLVTPEGIAVSSALCGDSICRVTIVSDQLLTVLMKSKGSLADLRLVPVTAECN